MSSGGRVCAGGFPTPTCPKAALATRKNASRKAERDSLRIVTSRPLLSYRILGYWDPKMPHQFTLTCANRKSARRSSVVHRSVSGSRVGFDELTSPQPPECHDACV